MKRFFHVLLVFVSFMVAAAAKPLPRVPLDDFVVLQNIELGMSMRKFESVFQRNFDWRDPVVDGKSLTIEFFARKKIGEIKLAGAVRFDEKRRLERFTARVPVELSMDDALKHLAELGGSIIEVTKNTSLFLNTGDHTDSQQYLVCIGNSQSLTLQSRKYVNHLPIKIELFWVFRMHGKREKVCARSIPNLS
jgi:hypothetical protein